MLAGWSQVDWNLGLARGAAVRPLVGLFRATESKVKNPIYTNVQTGLIRIDAE
jgi:hypothetical protein